MAALLRTAALLTCLLVCRAAPLDDPAVEEDPTTPTNPTVSPITKPTEANLIDVQEQIYITSGVFLTFIVFLMVVSLSTAYAVIGMRQKLRALQAAAGPASAASGQQRAPSRRPSPSRPTAAGPASRPAPGPARDNRGFAPEDDDYDDDYRTGDEVQDRFAQFPSDPARPRHASPSRGPQAYDRFHQRMPDAHMPSDRAPSPRRDSNSRYGAGNLARLPKGPSPQPAGYEPARYPDDRGRGHW